MKFIGCNGCPYEDSDVIQIRVEGGDNNDSIGDQVWISQDGCIMEIYPYADEEVLRETKVARR